ncbi:hypothetical protein DFH08DRAFT_1089803 [Mycena albidolilacea]|uniref:F-box domain-containing protein n=1 Tax=Mycena albidolilacea TaxID=1033008 RepID=A0AAD6YZZ3_9AGAR|nr:hypothetical protein DFH08DRAFT_1089803 [Mycena albidolilacea]
MLPLPNELILLICSHLEFDQDLWALSQVSSRIRCLTIIPLLGRHRISVSDIESGAITLRPQSFFLIPVVAHLHRIQKLTLEGWHHGAHGPGLREKQQMIRILGGVLGAIDNIPEIFLESDTFLTYDIGILQLLSYIPQIASRTLVAFMGSPIQISRPRRTPPIPWKPTFPFRSIPRTLQEVPTKFPIVNYLLAALPILFIALIVGVRNCIIGLAWTYRSVLGPAWGTEARLENDIGRNSALMWGLSFHIQTIGTAFTVVTIPTLSHWAASGPKSITICPLSGVSDDELSAIVADVKSVPADDIWVEECAYIRYSDLLLFLHHHPKLKGLGLRLDSIRALPFVPDVSLTTSIVSLSAPASYIPHLIPITPLLTNISIEFHPMRTHSPSWRRVVFSVLEYTRALDGVVSLPGTHALSLEFSFPSDAGNLPWLRIPDDPERASAPEVQLRRVTELHLAGGTTGFGAKTLGALPRWVRLFPALKRVVVLPGSRQRAIPFLEQRKLLQAISDACRGGEV